MTDSANPLSANRRTFLKVAITAGGTAAISGVTAAPVVETATRPVSPSPVAKQMSGGYRESDHIRKYYRTLRD